MFEESQYGTIQINSCSEFNAFRDAVIEKRQKYEKELALKCGDAKNGLVELPGFCEVCGEKALFEIDFLYSDGITPNFRERLVCPKCSLNSRQRYVVSTILKNYSSGEKIYLYEQITNVFRTVKMCVGENNVVGSEYFADGLMSGTKINGILHENAEELSFPNESFDTIVSCDVFEHVNDYKKCFAEAARVIKPGGKLYMSVPFYPDKQNNHRRAEINKGDLLLYDEPIYHGNPMCEDGSLVFWDYGWDILEDLKSSGFSNAYMQPYYSEKRGYLGGVPFIFIATKGSAEEKLRITEKNFCHSRTDKMGSQYSKNV